MRRPTKIISGLALAAGVGIGGVSVASADTYFYGNPNEPRVGLGRSVTADINSYYYPSPNTYSYSYRAAPSYYYAAPTMRHHSGGWNGVERQYRTTSQYAPLGSYYGTYRYPGASSYPYATDRHPSTFQYAPYGYDNDYDSTLSFQRRGQGYDGFIER